MLPKDTPSKVVTIDLTDNGNFSNFEPIPTGSSSSTSSSSSFPSPPVSIRPSAFSPTSLLSKRPNDMIAVTQSTHKHKESKREIQDFYTKPSTTKPVLPLSLPAFSSVTGLSAPASSSSLSVPSSIAALSVPSSLSSLDTLSRLRVAGKKESPAKVPNAPKVFSIPTFSSASGQQESRDSIVSPVSIDSEDEEEEDDSGYNPETIPSYFRDSYAGLRTVSANKKPSLLKSKLWRCFDRGERSKTSHYFVALCKYCHERMDGRLQRLKAHITDECSEIPEEERNLYLGESYSEDENDEVVDETESSRIAKATCNRKGGNKKRKSTFSSSPISAVIPPPPPIVEESTLVTGGGKRRVKAPKRLDLGWGPDSQWGKETSSSTSSSLATYSEHQHSTGSIYDTYPIQTQEIFDLLDEFSYGRNIQFEKEFPSLIPDDLTNVPSSSSTLPEPRLSSTARYLLSQIEEHEYLSKEDTIMENNETKENSLIYPIMVSIHGPVSVYAKTVRKELPPSSWNKVMNGNNRFAISEEYYALPQPYTNPPKTSKGGRKRVTAPSPLPTDSQIPINNSSITMWTTPLLLDCHLSGSGLPIKVSFFSSILNKQVVGFLFTYDRNELGYLVFYMDRGNVECDRIQSYELGICALEKSDKEVISLIWNSAIGEPFFMQQIKGNDEDNDR
jgi:hypothetical protein